MLTGSLPWTGVTELELKEKIKAGNLQVPDNISAEPRDLLESILVVNPSIRPSIRDILSHPWFNSGR